MAVGECFSLAERKEMKCVSHFSIRFLLVTTAEPDHIQKIESQLATDGKEKKKVSSFQDTMKAQRGH